MDTLKSVIKNSGIILFGRIFNTAASLTVSLLLARYLGKSGFGNYSFALAIMYFFIVIEGTWIEPIIIREVVRGNKTAESKIIGNAIIIKFVFSLIVVILILLFRLLTNMPNEVAKLIYLILILLPIVSGISSYEIIFRVYLSMKYYVWSTFLRNILLIFLVSSVIFLKGPVTYFIIAMILTDSLVLCLLIYFSKRFVVPIFKIKWKLCKNILKNSLPLALTAVFIAIYYRIDQLMLFKMVGPGALGSYSVPVRIVEAFNIIPLALGASIFPLMSKYFKSSMEKFKKIYQLSFRYLAIFIIPVAMWISLFSKSIIYFIYGKEFLTSSSTLAILIWSAMFVFFGVVNMQILISSDNQKLDPLFTGASAMINVLLNLILIPRFSFIGAAIATLVAAATGPVMGYFIRATREYSLSMLRHSIKPLFGSFIMGIAIYFTHLPFLYSIIFAPLIYLTIMRLINGIEQNDLRMLKSILSQQN